MLQPYMFYHNGTVMFVALVVVENNTLRSCSTRALQEAIGLSCPEETDDGEVAQVVFDRSTNVHRALPYITSAFSGRSIS